jgi:hypothetical protein
MAPKLAGERQMEKRKPDDAEESKRFVDAARQLESDESGKSFERAFGAVAPKKPKPKEKKK